MRFLSIELKDCKRFALNNISLLRLTMDEVIQIILGRNGCGKSWLLKEMSLLPAESKHYGKLGHKIITCKHEQDIYTLTSKFHPTTKHSFLKNNEIELNEGGTAAVQKDLVKTIFGITADFINVAMGLEPFTGMSPSRRRELFTQMCPTDYDYAIGVYNRIKENLRDTNGAIKVAKKRLSQEISGIVDDQEYECLRKHLDELTNKSKELYQKKITQTPNRQDSFLAVQEVVNSIHRLASTYWGTRKNILENNYWSPSEICQEIEQQRLSINRENALLSVLTEEYNKQKQKIGNEQVFDNQELLAIKNKAITIAQENKTLLNGLKTTITATNVDKAKMAMDFIKDRLKELLSSLQDNTDNWFSFDKLAVESDKLVALKTNHVKSLKFIDSLNNAIVHYEHLLKEEEAQCPQCNHLYRHGYDEKRHHAIVAKRDAGLKHVEQLDKDIAALQIIVDDMMLYSTKLNQLKNIIANYPELEELWVTLINVNELKSHPAVISSKIDAFNHDLCVLQSVNANNKILLDIKSKLDTVNASVEKDIRNEKEKLSHIEDNIGYCSSRINSLNKAIQQNQNYIKQVEFAEKMGARMRDLKTELDNCLKVADNAILNDLIDHILTDTHIEIANISTKVSDMTTKRALVEDLKNQIIKLEKEEQAYKLLSDVFSPTDGIIAEGLLGFIRAFVKAMNSTIAKIWTYKLKVLDCSTDDQSADLNYKFPVEVESDPEPRDDVKDGSSAMKEIINLAYRLVAMTHMGMAKYPLMIDEFGSFFDAEHKSRAPYAIKAISEQMDFEQIFIISHHQLEYTMFPRAQFCVLDKNNILLSSNMVFNKHVVIE